MLAKLVSLAAVAILEVMAAAGADPLLQQGACTHDPCYAPPAFDCPLRQLALEYANTTLGTGADLNSIVSALNLSACDHTVPVQSRMAAKRSEQVAYSLASATVDGRNLVVVAETGSDTAGDGSLASPFATIHRAQIKARQLGPGTVVSIRAGTYYLPAPLVLTEEDSGTSYVNHPGEQPVLSGGEPLHKLTWTQWRPPLPMGAADSCTLILHNHTGCTRDPYHSFHTESLGDCCSACSADSSCSSFTFNDPTCRLSATGFDRCYNGRESGATCGTKTPLPAEPQPCPSPSPGPHPAPAPAGPTPPPKAAVWVASLSSGIEAIESLFLTGTAPHTISVYISVCVCV